MGMIRSIRFSTWMLRAFIKTMVAVSLVLLEAVWWTGWGLYRLSLLVHDMVAGLWRLRKGTVSCPCGATVPDQGFFECGNCSGRYYGSCWVCGICSSPSSLTSCPSCGRSVMSPYLWGWRAGDAR